MNPKPGQSLRNVLFEGQLLPQWAQLLDLASRLGSAPEQTTAWFSRFARCSGVDDSRAVMEHCSVLLAKVEQHKKGIIFDLKHSNDDREAELIYQAWVYALETMMLEAQSRSTCSWLLEERNATSVGASPPGDISLRRI